MPKVYISPISESIEASIQKTLTYLEWEKGIPRDAKIFFKPNLTYPVYKAGVTTSPEFIEAVLKVFSSRCRNLIVGESDGGYRSWPAEVSFKNHGLPEICNRYGAKLVNLSKASLKTMVFDVKNRKVELKLPEILLDDEIIFITLPVPKIHQVTYFTGAIKNQWGCIPDTMRLLNHPFFDELILEINRLLRVRFALADGKYFLNKAGPMLGGILVFKNLVIGSDSIGALDAVLCRIMGLKYINIRYLRYASRSGWIHPEQEITINITPEIFFDQKFYLKRSLRNRVVAWAFDRQWAVKLIWDSRFGDFIHWLLYLIVGNPVIETISKITDHKEAQ